MVEAPSDNVEHPPENAPAQSALNLPDLSFVNDSLSAITSWIHPGHFFLATSLPFCWSAYRGYQTPLLDRVVQNVLKGQNVRPEDLAKAQDTVRKAVGSAVASRALRVATYASVGSFGILTAGLFYWSGCNSVEEAVASTRQWAHNGRRRVDSFFGIENRVDKDHPEYLLMQSMSEEEELEFVANNYLPDEQWVDDDVDDEDKASSQNPP